MKTFRNILAIIAISAGLLSVESFATPATASASNAKTVITASKVLAKSAKKTKKKAAKKSSKKDKQAVEAKAEPAQAPAAEPAKAEPAQAPAAQPAQAQAAQPAQAPAAQPAQAQAPAAKPAQAQAQAAKPAQAQAPAAKPVQAQAPAAKPAQAQAPAAKPAQAPAAAAVPANTTQVATADSAQTVTTDSLSVQRKPKRRNKIYYQDLMDSLKREAARKAAITYHHGISLSGGIINDKNYGDFRYDNNWGGSFGIYYYYRHYFGTHFALQGRAGGLYRYSSFREDIKKSPKEINGEEYNLVQHVDLNYSNFALDMPLSIKVGGHVEPTTFIYAGVTFGLTKPLLEELICTNELDIEGKTKKARENIEILEREGLNPYPLEAREELDEPFFIDDWETNLWANLGIDGKYISIEGQVFIIGASTKDNHRFDHIFHKQAPTWRFMVDFSVR